MKIFKRFGNIQFSCVVQNCKQVRSMYVLRFYGMSFKRFSTLIIFCGEIPARDWGGDLNYFWKSKFWIFQDSYNFVCATPKWRDEVIAAEISVISSEIRNHNFQWESRIRHFEVNRRVWWPKFLRSHRKFKITIFDENLEFDNIRSIRTADGRNFEDFLKIQGINFLGES